MCSNLGAKCTPKVTCVWDVRLWEHYPHHLLGSATTCAITRWDLIAGGLIGDTTWKAVFSSRLSLLFSASWPPWPALLLQGLPLYVPTCLRASWPWTEPRRTVSLINLSRMNTLSERKWLTQYPLYCLDQGVGIHIQTTSTPGFAVSQFSSPLFPSP